jgi:putative flippase GtrA
MIIKVKKFLLLYFSAQFLRFLFAGGIGAGINLGFRLFFRNYLDLGYVTSYLYAYLIGFFAVFFLYKRFVFPFSDLPIQTQINRFFIINLSFAPISAILFISFTQLLNLVGFKLLSEPIAHAISIGTPAIITFLLYKFLAFKKGNTQFNDLINKR